MAWPAYPSAVLVLLLSASGSAFAEGFNEEFAEALKSGEFGLNFRYRFEFVDQDSTGPADPVTDNAKASTLRTRLVYTTGDFRGWTATINMDDIRPVVSSDFNDTRNGKTEYPTVSDPKGTDVNIAALTYSGLENAEFVFGRQRILRGNQRFVGNVGWRQNEQTFDAVSAEYVATDKLKLYYGYIDTVKRLFGPDSGSPPDEYSGSTHLFDGGYSFAPWLNLFGYVYLMDLEGNGDDSASNRTAGLRLNGSFELTDALNLDYTAEYAQQEDYADNPNDYDEGYYRIDGGVSGESWSLLATREVLEASGTAGESFQTPLATLHGFQGLADIFTNPLPDGVEDTFLTGKLKVVGIDLLLAYHDFQASEGSQDYGTEIDFTASMPFAKYYSAFIGGAVYDADDFGTDTTKIWVMLTADF